MEIKLTCPLGHECEKAVDNVIHRCAWYVEVLGKHPQSEEQLSEFRCSLTWMPILLLENARTNRGQTDAICSLRNEQVSGQKEFVNMLAVVAQKRLNQE